MGHYHIRLCETAFGLCDESASYAKTRDRQARFLPSVPPKFNLI